MNHINTASTNLIEDFDADSIRSRGKYNDYFEESDDREVAGKSKRFKKKRDRRESFSDWN